jgi:PAS domain S-box-containing protein
MKRKEGPERRSRRDTTVVPQQAGENQGHAGDPHIHDTFQELELPDSHATDHRPAQETYRTVVEYSLQGLAILQEGRIVFANPAAARLTGYTIEELSVLSPGEVSALIHPEDRARCCLNLQECLVEGQGSPRQEQRLIRRDGQECWAEILARPITYQRKPALQIACVDISERKQAERALQHRLAIEELVATISTRFIHAGSEGLQDEMDRTLQALGEFAGVDHCHLTLFSEAGTAIERMYEWHAVEVGPRAQDLQGLLLEPFGWVMEKLARSETVYVPRVADLPPEANPAKAFWQASGIQSVLTIPLVLGQSLVGVLGFSMERSGKAWSVDDIRLLRLVAEILGGVLARERMERALRESKERYRLMVDLCPSAIAIHSIGRVVFVNPAGLKLIGAARTEDVVGRPILDFVHASYHDIVTERVRQFDVDEAPLPLIEERLIRLDGAVIDVQVAAMPLVYEGQPAVQVVIHDITERKRAERAIQDSEEKFRTLAEESPNMIFINKGGRVVYANERCKEVTGYERTEFYAPDFDFITLIAPEGRDQVRASFEAHQRGQEVAPYEYALVTREGRRVDVLVSTRLIDYEGEQAILGIVTDITRQKRVEEALRRSLEETAHGQRLLLTLSRAAQAVQRARTPAEVYRVVDDQIAKLGYRAFVWTLSADRAHLELVHLTIQPALVRAAEKLAGLSAEGYRFPLVPGGFYQRILAEGKTIFSCQDERPIVEALHPSIRPLAARLAGIFGVRQSIVAPLVVAGEAHGVLFVAGEGLAEHDVPAVTTFANQAAIAIENAQLLSAVRDQKADLQVLSTRLMHAQETERRRISRELHDEMGQRLTAMSIDLAAVARDLPQTVGPLVEERLLEARLLADQTLEEVRELGLNLWPSMLDDLGLVPTLRWYVNQQARRLALQIALQAAGLEERLAPELETALYRIVQEALTNVARHAQASKVSLCLKCKGPMVLLRIEDDGRGFEIGDPAAPYAAARGTGLLGMRERVTFLGGRFRVESQPGQGTRLLAEVPVRWRNGS